MIKQDVTLLGFVFMLLMIDKTPQGRLMPHNLGVHSQLFTQELLQISTGDLGDWLTVEMGR